jgi:hypothetical protein
LKVDIIVPLYRVTDPECDTAIQLMVGKASNEGLDVRMPRLRGHALIHRVRNEALIKIRPDADWVLWCDDDMYPRQDSLLRLLDHSEGEHVISALTTTRDDWPPRLIPKAWSSIDDRFVQIPETDWPKHMGNIVRGKFGVGFGFVLTSKKILDEATEFYLSAKDWITLNQNEHNRLHVRKEYREKERTRIEQERRSRFEENKFLLVFQQSVQENQLERGEDVHFSRLCIEMGHHMSIDTTVQVPHMGKCPYGPHLLGVNDWNELRLEEKMRIPA